MSWKKSYGETVVLATISALPGVPGIFIENIQTDLGFGNVEVRLGYFGMSFPLPCRSSIF